jgi:membrane fusion protein, multidrug efflux system
MLGLFKRYGFAAVVAVGLGLMTFVVLGKTVWDGVGSAVATASSPGGGRPGGGGGPGGPAPQVVAAQVAMHTFNDGLRAIGTAQARESIVLTPKVADTIRIIRFDSGDRVQRGQVLVEMSSVEQAADFAEVRAANEAAQEELRRTQELFDRGFASQARLDTVRASAEASAARLNAGGSRIADRTIRAPFAGVVGLRTASPGQYMRPGEQIGTLDDISEIKLDFDVPETQIARLAQGVEIVANTAAYPDRTFNGTIADIDSRVIRRRGPYVCGPFCRIRMKRSALACCLPSKCAPTRDKAWRSRKWRSLIRRTALMSIASSRAKADKRSSLCASRPANALTAWPKC